MCIRDRWITAKEHLSIEQNQVFYERDFEFVISKPNNGVHWKYQVIYNQGTFLLLKSKMVRKVKKVKSMKNWGRSKGVSPWKISNLSQNWGKSKGVS